MDRIQVFARVCLIYYQQPRLTLTIAHNPARGHHYWPIAPSPWWSGTPGGRARISGLW